MTPAITNANAYDARASLQHYYSFAPFGEGGGLSLGDQAIETEKPQKPTFHSAYLSMSFQQFIADAAPLKEHEFGFVPIC